MINLTLLLLLSAVCVPTLPSRPNYSIKETHKAPIQWVKIGPAPGEHLIQLQIALKQSNGLELERRLYEVSDPSHKQYGKHLTAAEVNALVEPAEESIFLVEEWLLEHGISEFRYNPAKDWISTPPIPVDLVETLLDTKYYVFRRVEDGTIVIRTEKWSLPSHIHDHIDTIQPTVSFLGFQKISSSARRSVTLESKKWINTRGETNLRDKVPTYEELAAFDIVELDNITVPNIHDISGPPTVTQVCNRLAISPLCIRVLYGTYNYTPQAPPQNKLGIVNYLGETTNLTDIAKYISLYRPDATTYNLTSETVKNPATHQTPNNPGLGLEAAIDAQTAIGISFPTQIITYDTPGHPDFHPSQSHPKNANEPYLEWLHHVLAQPTLPQVITTSYADEEQTVPYAYAQRVCQGFAQLGARGISVIFASGDDGVGKDGACISNDGKNKTIFLPSFPASCPFVTAVGATRHFEPEVVAFDARNHFVSGGGFSNYFERPRYQDQAIQTYFNRADMVIRGFEGLYNGGGRGIPDVAALGYHYTIIHDGESNLSDGTSAAGPTFAAIIALVNDALMAGGKPPLGFLNPWIYSKAYGGFTDVVHGSARGCNTTGFPALEGWDPVTGFGTPWFPKLKELALDYRYRATRPWYYKLFEQ